MNCIFFAGLEHGLSESEVVEYRFKYGRMFESIGLHVNDPTLGKEVAHINRDQLLKQDRALVEASDITVAYLPSHSDGALREVKWAQNVGQLVFGFTDEGNPCPDEFVTHLHHWCSSVDELMKILSIFSRPPGTYLTSSYTNRVRGNVLIYGVELHLAAPHLLAKVITELQMPKNIYQFCCERSHVNELTQKLPTILRLGDIASLTVMTKDGSPHDVQMHTLVQEVIENQGFAGKVRHLVVEHGMLGKEFIALAVSATSRTV